MSEKQPTAYVVCRYRVYTDGTLGDNRPFKVFDTRREARAYVARLQARTRRFGYIYYSVKQG